MNQRTLDDAKEVVRRYCSSAYPEATLILLCGSWSRNTANEDSDIDILVLDPGTAGYVFTCVEYESWLLELAVVSPENFDNYIKHDTRRRDATISIMYAEGIVIQGNEDLAREVKSKAQKIIDNGPPSLSEAQKQELRVDLTVLLKDLKHAPVKEIPAIAAQCHTSLAKAVIDARGGWRGEEKTLRPALARVDPLVADRLDEGLILACRGNTLSLIQLCREVIDSLGGELRTYFTQYPASDPDSIK